MLEQAVESGLRLFADNPLTLVFGLVSAYAVWKRFWWGEQSRVSFRQLPDPRSRKWSSTKNTSRQEGRYWANYVHLLAINAGWLRGVLWNMKLCRITADRETFRVEDVGEEVDLQVEGFVEGEARRFDLKDPHSRTGRNIDGRDNSHFKIVIRIEEEGEIEDFVTTHSSADFKFEATIQDNQGPDTTSFTATLPVENIPAQRNRTR